MDKMRYSEKNMNDVVKQGLVAFYVLARANVMQRWKKLSYKEKRDAVQALAFMNEVQQNPAKYFSREQTYNDWVVRAQGYARENNLKNEMYAYYIVQTPYTIVTNQAIPAVVGDLYRDYYRFCHNVLQWEYDRTSSHESFRFGAPGFADRVIDQSAEMVKRAEIENSNCFVKPLKQLAYSLQH